MAGVTEAGAVQRLLVDRIGDDRRRPPGLRIGDGHID